MEMKRMFVQVVNLETGKVFSLPTLYTDRAEACVCGQNYIRDRQVEDPCSELFFRVLITKDGQVAPEDYLWDDQLEEEEDEFDWEDPACQSSQKANEESVFGGVLVTELIDLLRSKAPEEPNYETYGWND